MSDVVMESLILDLLEWLAIRDRGHDEVMDAWRTARPTRQVWERAEVAEVNACHRQATGVNT